MTRLDDGEVTTIQGSYLGDTEPLGKSDHRGVNGAERQVTVLPDEVSHPSEVLDARIKTHQPPSSQEPEERLFDVRTATGLQHVAGLSHNRTRHRQLTGPLPQKVRTSA